LLDKVFKSHRKNDPIAKVRTTEKKQGCARDERQYEFLFATGQAWRDKPPELIKNIWTGEQYTRRDSDLDLAEKGFGNAGSD
jgi:hypothetical protein